MYAIVLCALALAACFYAGRRSLVAGLVAVAGVGYLYGIVRANVPQPASHFVFDAGVMGFYAAVWMRSLTLIQRYKTRDIRGWTAILILWPALLFFVPAQDPLIQLVGLRGQIVFLPFLIVGGMLEAEEIYTVGLWLAVLNLIAFGFAGAESLLGVERFFPRNAVTELIYRSRDVAGGALRIPSTFVNSAEYGSVMVVTIPLLVGAWIQRNRPRWQHDLITVSLAAAAIGVFFAASRTQAAVLIAMIGALTLFGRLRGKSHLLWLALVAAVAWIVYSAPTMQRFTTLANTNFVEHRLSGSVNSGFLGLAEEYPIGNGLGGGGTSIPYFLRSRLEGRVTMENEYARIMLEQGIPGLCLWVCFIAWLLTRPLGRRSDPWYRARWLARLMCLLYFGVAVSGTGLLTSMPFTALFLMSAGWSVARQPRLTREMLERHRAAGAMRDLRARRFGW